MAGFEPTTFWSRTKRASQTALHPGKTKKILANSSLDYYLVMQKQLLLLEVEGKIEKSFTYKHLQILFVNICGIYYHVVQ